MYNEDFQYNFISIIIIWKYNKKKLIWIKNINGDSSCIKYFILTITNFQYFLLNILFYFVLLNFCCNYDKGYLFVYYKKKNIVKHWYRENRVDKIFQRNSRNFFFHTFCTACGLALFWWKITVFWFKYGWTIFIAAASFNLSSWAHNS